MPVYPPFGLSDHNTVVVLLKVRDNKSNNIVTEVVRYIQSFSVMFLNFLIKKTRDVCSLSGQYASTLR